MDFVISRLHKASFWFLPGRETAAVPRYLLEPRQIRYMVATISRYADICRTSPTDYSFTGLFYLYSRVNSLAYINNSSCGCLFSLCLSPCIRACKYLTGHVGSYRRPFAATANAGGSKRTRNASLVSFCLRSVVSPLLYSCN